MEPTTYAMLALQDKGSGIAADRAWKLVRSWQNADGSYRPNGEVKDGTWVEMGPNGRVETHVDHGRKLP